MMSSYEIADFFYDRDMFPGQQELITHKEYVAIMFDAMAKGDIFFLFVKEIVVNAAYHQYYFNADTWEELYNHYLQFSTGYRGNKA